MSPALRAAKASLPLPLALFALLVLMCTGTAHAAPTGSQALAVLTSKEVAFRLFHEIGPRYKDRSGGYTRIYKLAKVRQGDAAPMAVISLLGESETIKAPAKPAVVGSSRGA